MTIINTIITTVMFFALMMSLPINAQPINNNVIIARSRLFVDQQEFIIQGINYNPTPLGQATMSPDAGTGGTGLCSQQMTPFKQWKSNCYDGDYFDGTPWHVNASVNGFEAIWLRDFPQMVTAGINTVRIFNCNPNTTAATSTFTNLFSSPTGRNHTLFMNTAAAYGLRVIFPLYFNDDDFATLDETDYMRYLRWQIDEVGNSSSLLMWQFGDEQSWTWVPAAMNNATIIAKYNNYADYIKRYTYSRWNRMVPITMSMQWDQRWFGLLIAALHIDVFSANIYTMSSYSLLFDGDVTFEGFSTATCKYNKPFLITGFGPTYLPSVAYNRRDINQIWQQVIKNIDNGLIGAIYYEFSDNAYMNHRFGLVNVSVAYSKTGSGSSTRVNSLIPDAIGRKQQFRDMQSGTYNGVSYNLRTSPFDLLQRGQDTLFSAEDRCVSLGTFYDCPTNSQYQVCSGNGMCNRMNGTCTCGTGWAGLNCATPVCPGTPMCSLNGVCSTFVSPPQCVCSPGFYGPACESMFRAGMCPSLCSGNGICGPNGGCSCFAGWIGADCAITDVKVYSGTTFGTLTSSASSAATTSSAATKSSISTTSSASKAVTVASTSTASIGKTSSSSTKSVSSSSTATVLDSTSTGAVSSSSASVASTSSSTSSLETSVSSLSSEALSMVASTSSTSTSSASVSSAHTVSTSTKQASISKLATTSSASYASSYASTASTKASSTSAALKTTSTTAAAHSSSTSSSTSAQALSSSTSRVAVTTAQIVSSSTTSGTSSESGSVDEPPHMNAGHRNIASAMVLMVTTISVSLLL